MAWWEYAWFPYTVNSYLYHRAIPDKPKLKPGNASNIPRSDEGAPLPMIYGRCRVQSPVLIWIGNWLVVPHGADALSYEVDMLFVVGLPFYGGGATLSLLYAGDFQLTLIPRSDSMDRPGRYTYGTSNGFDLYGGDQKGGGITGEIEFFDGRRDQQLSDYINDVDPHNWTILQGRLTRAKFSSLYDHPELIDETLQPGYRNQVVCLMYTWNIGEQPNFTSYSFEVTSLSTGTPSDFGRSLPQDADPAAVLLDVLTSPAGKLGIPVSKIDISSFDASSLTLFGEGHGYSRAIESETDAIEIIDDVLRQTDGMLYEEPTTGKLVYKLVRFDYDVGSLDDINPDNARPGGAGWYQVRGWTETFNLVRVFFTDRANNYADGMQPAQDDANAAGQNRGVRGTDVHFPGCCTRDTAVKIAARELAAKSRPIARATVICNRSFYQARPGSVYTLTWPELGINHMVMRVSHVDLGQLADSAITLSLIQDIFDVQTGAFPAP